MSWMLGKPRSNPTQPRRLIAKRVKSRHVQSNALSKKHTRVPMLPTKGREGPLYHSPLHVNNQPSLYTTVTKTIIQFQLTSISSIHTDTMTSQITPSKKVCYLLPQPIVVRERQLLMIFQAASSLESLKMNDSPIKKLDFSTAGKENLPFEAQAPVDAIVDTKKPVVEEPNLSLIASTLRPEEADEPLLQANPNRFVLFPIKYHEVCIYFLSTRRY